MTWYIKDIFVPLPKGEKLNIIINKYFNLLLPVNTSIRELWTDTFIKTSTS